MDYLFVYRHSFVKFGPGLYTLRILAHFWVEMTAVIRFHLRRNRVLSS